MHLQLKSLAHEQNTRLAVSSQVQQGSVADKGVFCKEELPFEAQILLRTIATSMQFPLMQRLSIGQTELDLHFFS